ncbi:D-alanyl-D-alanine carboxypeptidase family protein [Patulibacter sp.]|uniref:D-alanyl-D-alanine carboxypeptidase family protein n=1 Tax=Patulibacter sp. TaxID=1912859 RepID=UPI00271FF6FD|nr:D-alanyl-D-alanine carboxypeptidase family protein [Patulibacter sp.]MDO9410574.1 D-alanyl-D-alanine carboxypeptidase family protein [Patulibacter sp.]
MRRVALLLVVLVLGPVLSGCGGGSATAQAGSGPDGEDAPTVQRTPLQGVNGPPSVAPLAVPLKLQAAAPEFAAPGFVNPLRKQPRAGLVADLDTGKVLWAHSATRSLPIASVTKLMTALVVDGNSRPTERVRISRKAVAAQGSRVGLLPLYKKVQLETMQYGLLLASGNDAAVALAEHVGGTVENFVAMMNAQARALGLTCTTFASPSGFEETRTQREAKNRSCATDLAVLGRAVLDQPRLAKIVGTNQAVRPFPIKGRKLFLQNHNPLLKQGFPGTIGLKTGFTNAAGKTFVGAVSRGGHRLVVVLLNTPDIPRQAEALLNRGFRALGVRAR